MKLPTESQTEMYLEILTTIQSMPKYRNIIYKGFDVPLFTERYDQPIG